MATLKTRFSIPLSNNADTYPSLSTATDVSAPKGAPSTFAAVSEEGASNWDTPLDCPTVPKLMSTDWGKRPVDAAHGIFMVVDAGLARVPSALNVSVPVTTGLL